VEVIRLTTHMPEVDTGTQSHPNQADECGPQMSCLTTFLMGVYAVLLSQTKRLEECNATITKMRTDMNENRKAHLSITAQMDALAARMTAIESNRAKRSINHRCTTSSS
jgi:hypothetical protein